MAELFVNDVTTTLASTTTTSATTLTVASGTGLPSPTGGDFARLRLEPAVPDGTFELVRYTARSGASLSGVARAQEGTTGVAWASGAKVTAIFTAGWAVSLVTLADAQTIAGAKEFTANPTTGGVDIATTDDVAAVAATHTADKALSIGLCIEVSGTYPTRPSGFGMVQFRGVDDPNALSLMVEGDDWVDLS